MNLNVEVVKGLRLLTNNYWSDGGGRYIYGEAPDLIAHADGSLSLVHSGSTVTGFEFAHKNTQLYGYYGGMYVMRNTAVDTNGKLVGWGIPAVQMRSAQNREIQEATFGFNQTIWKNPKYGAVQFMGQYSYLTRVSLVRVGRNAPRMLISIWCSSTCATRCPAPLQPWESKHSQSSNAECAYSSHFSVGFGPH